MTQKGNENVLNLPTTDSFHYRWKLAEKALLDDDSEKALSIFYALANDGFAESYVEIGRLLELKSEVDGKKYLDEAIEWYAKAIEETSDSYGYVGLARLALAEHSAAGTIKDALEYLEIAASDDNPHALSILGAIHEEGKIVDQNLAKAIDFYEKASLQGYVLPTIKLSALLWGQGEYARAVRLRLRAITTMFRLYAKNRTDPRLWGVVQQRA